MDAIKRVVGYAANGTSSGPGGLWCLPNDIVVPWTNIEDDSLTLVARSKPVKDWSDYELASVRVQFSLAINQVFKNDECSLEEIAARNTNAFDGLFVVSTEPAASLTLRSFRYIDKGGKAFELGTYRGVQRNIKTTTKLFETNRFSVNEASKGLSEKKWRFVAPNVFSGDKVALFAIGSATENAPVSTDIRLRCLQPETGSTALYVDPGGAVGWRKSASGYTVVLLGPWEKNKDKKSIQVMDAPQRAWIAPTFFSLLGATGVAAAVPSVKNDSAGRSLYTENIAPNFEATIGDATWEFLDNETMFDGKPYFDAAFQLAGDLQWARDFRCGKPDVVDTLCGGLSSLVPSPPSGDATFSRVWVAEALRYAMSDFKQWQLGHTLEEHENIVFSNGFALGALPFQAELARLAVANNVHALGSPGMTEANQTNTRLQVQKLQKPDLEAELLFRNETRQLDRLKLDDADDAALVVAACQFERFSYVAFRSVKDATKDIISIAKIGAATGCLVELHNVTMGADARVEQLWNSPNGSLFVVASYNASTTKFTLAKYDASQLKRNSESLVPFEKVTNNDTRVLRLVSGPGGTCIAVASDADATPVQVVTVGKTTIDVSEKTVRKPAGFNTMQDAVWIDDGLVIIMSNGKKIDTISIQSNSKAVVEDIVALNPNHIVTRIVACATPNFFWVVTMPIVEALPKKLTILGKFLNDYIPYTGFHLDDNGNFEVRFNTATSLYNFTVKLDYVTRTWTVNGQYGNYKCDTGPFPFAETKQTIVMKAPYTTGTYTIELDFDLDQASGELFVYNALKKEKISGLQGTARLASTFDIFFFGNTVRTTSKRQLSYHFDGTRIAVEARKPVADAKASIVPVGACGHFFVADNKDIKYSPSNDGGPSDIQEEIALLFPESGNLVSDCEKMIKMKWGTSVEKDKMLLKGSDLGTVLAGELSDPPLVAFADPVTAAVEGSDAWMASKDGTHAQDTADGIRFLCTGVHEGRLDWATVSSARARLQNIDSVKAAFGIFFQRFPFLEIAKVLDAKTTDTYDYLLQPAPELPVTVGLSREQLTSLGGQIEFDNAAVEYFPWQRFGSYAEARKNPAHCGFLGHINLNGDISVAKDTVFWPNNRDVMPQVVPANAEMAVNAKHECSTPATATNTFAGYCGTDLVTLSAENVLKQGNANDIADVACAATSTSTKSMVYVDKDNKVKVITDEKKDGEAKACTVPQGETVVAVAVADKSASGNTVVGVVCTNHHSVVLFRTSFSDATPIWVGEPIASVGTPVDGSTPLLSVTFAQKSKFILVCIYVGQSDGAVYETVWKLQGSQSLTKVTDPIQISATQYGDEHAIRTLDAVYVPALDRVLVCACTETALAVFVRKHWGAENETPESRFLIYPGWEDARPPSSACFDPVNPQTVWCWNRDLQCITLWNLKSNTVALNQEVNGRPCVYAADLSNIASTLYAAQQYPFGDAAFFQKIESSTLARIVVCPHPSGENALLPLTVDVTLDMLSCRKLATLDNLDKGAMFAVPIFTDYNSDKAISYYPKVTNPTYQIVRREGSPSSLYLLDSKGAPFAVYTIVDIDCSEIAFPGGMCTVLPHSISSSKKLSSTLTPYTLMIDKQNKSMHLIPKHNTRALPFYETRYITDADCLGLFETPTSVSGRNTVRQWLIAAETVHVGNTFKYTSGTGYTHLKSLSAAVLKFEDVACNTLCSAPGGNHGNARARDPGAVVPDNSIVHFSVTSSRMPSCKIKAAELATQLHAKCLGSFYPDSKVLSSGKRAYLKATDNMLGRLHVNDSARKIVFIPQLAAASMHRITRPKNNDDWIIFYEELMRAPRENALIRPYTVTVSGVSTPTIMQVQGCYVPSIRYASILASVLTAVHSVLRDARPLPHSEDDLFSKGKVEGTATGALLGRAMVNKSLYEQASADYGQRFKDRNALAHITDQHTQAIYALARVWGNAVSGGAAAGKKVGLFASGT